MPSAKSIINITQMRSTRFREPTPVGASWPRSLSTFSFRGYVRQRKFERWISGLRGSRIDSQLETQTLEPDELQLAIKAAQRKRCDVLDALPAACHAKILTMLPKAAEAYRQQIERSLDNDPREAATARVILRDLLGATQLCAGQDGSLWDQYHTRPRP